MREANPTARFWTWLNDGWVKLSLRPGEELLHSVGGLHDEGWFHRSTSWVYLADDAVIVRETMSDGTDCDGRISHGWSDVCPVAELAFNEADDGTPIPAWTNQNRYQRDYSAEAMGY